MRDAERARVAAEARKPLQQCARRARARAARRAARIPARARDRSRRPRRLRLAIEVGPQTHARDAGRGLDGEHALGGNLVPVRYGRLRNADAAGEFGNSADRLYGFAQTRIAHQSLMALGAAPHHMRSVQKLRPGTVVVNSWAIVRGYIFRYWGSAPPWVRRDNCCGFSCASAWSCCTAVFSVLLCSNT